MLIGGDEGDRTPYLVTASHTLSQMSYTPEGFDSTLNIIPHCVRFVNSFWKIKHYTVIIRCE